MSKVLFRVSVESPEMSEIVQLVAFNNGYGWNQSKIVSQTDKNCLGFWRDKDMTYTLYDSALQDNSVPLLNVVDAIKVLTQVETLESLESKKWPKKIADDRVTVYDDGSVDLTGFDHMNCPDKDDMVKLCTEYLKLFPGASE